MTRTTHPLPRGAAITAAITLTLMAGVAGTAHALVVAPLLAGTTTEPSGFGLAVAAFGVVAVLDVIVSVALYDALAPAGRWLAALAAAFRLVYTAVLAAAVGMLAAGASVALALFDSTWQFGLGLFGVHLALVGVLVYRMGGSGRIIGPLVSLAGIGYVVDSYARLLAPEAGLALAQFTFVGEVVLIVWLVARAIRTPRMTT